LRKRFSGGILAANFYSGTDIEYRLLSSRDRLTKKILGDILAAIFIGDRLRIP